MKPLNHNSMGAAFIFLLGFILSGCQDHVPIYVGERAKILNMAGAAQDVQLPTELFDKLIGTYEPQLLDKAGNDPESESKAKTEIPTEFFSFHVFLAEKTKNVLGGNNYDLMYGKGGGLLDLKDFVQSEKGSFYFGLKADLPEYEKETLKVYFLSHSAKRSVGEENFGSGCNVYFDITDHFKQSMVKEGFLVNVTNQRHVSLLSGTFFFAISIRGHLYLSQLTVRDSRYRKFQCP